MRLVYAEDAVGDLSRLRAFIAEKDPAAAGRVAADLIARIDHLSRFPEMGRAVPQAPLPAAVRDVILGKCVVRYSVHAEAIVILRIWHHFEDR